MLRLFDWEKTSDVIFATNDAVAGKKIDEIWIHNQSGASYPLDHFPRCEESRRSKKFGWSAYDAQMRFK